MNAGSVNAALEKLGSDMASRQGGFLTQNKDEETIILLGTSGNTMRLRNNASSDRSRLLFLAL
jgi:hypothetical protein